MKKSYFFFALLMAIFVPMLASAESRTVKIHVDNPSNISEIKCGDYGVDRVFTIGDDNCFEVTFGDDKANGDIKELHIFAIVDARLVGITREDGSAPVYDGAYAYGTPVSVREGGKYIYFTGFGGSWSGFGVEDKETLYLETKVIPAKTLTFTGHPGQMSLQSYDSAMFKYVDAEPKEAGVWEFNGNAQNEVKVVAKEGYLISSIQYTNDEESGEVASATMVTSKIITSSDYSSSTSFTVVTIGEEEARTASITVKMPAGADVAIQRNGKNVELTEDAEQTIKFNPLNDEKSFKVVRKSDATRKLYEANFTPAAEGEPTTSSSFTSFAFTATDGGVLEITPEFPDVDIPVHFSFVNEGTEGSITSVKVNGTALEEGAWLANDFSVKLSDKIELVRNTDDYEFKGYWISVNGTASSNASFEVLDSEVEGGYTVEITARKYDTVKVSIVAPAYKYYDIRLANYINWNYVYTPIDVDEEGKAEVEVKLSDTFERIDFASKIGVYNYVSRYVIDEDTKAILDDDGWGGNSGQVKASKLYDGMTIRCVAEKKRTEKTYVYLEDTDWTSNDMLLEAGDVFEATVALEPGDYTEVDICKVNDKTPNDFSAAGFAALGGSPVVYLNDVKLEETEGVLEGIDNVKAGDIIKVYSEEKTPYDVNYTIEEGINVAVTHDKVTSVATSDAHKVLPGTHVHITPIATMADVEGDSTEGIKVTCNGVEVTPNEDGVYALKVNDHSAIKVMSAGSTSISEISDADASSAPAYDLQGRRVNASAKGIVISAGKIQIRK